MKKLLILLLLLLFSTQLLFAKTSHDPDGKLLSDWIKVHLQLIRSNKATPHVAYSRHFSYSSIALYESIVNSDKKCLSLSNQLQDYHRTAAAPKNLNVLASANACYATMLRYFYSSNPKIGVVDSLEKMYLNRFSASGIKQKEIEQSADFGKEVAKEVVAWSEQDHSADHYPVFNPREGEESWKPTPPSFAAPAMPYFGRNREFVKGCTSFPFVVNPPMYSKESSSEFYKMAKDLYDVSKTLSDEERNIAMFWDDSPNGKHYSAFGHWSSILAQLIDEKKITLIKAAEAYAKMHLALTSSSIKAWQGKYQFQVVRPIGYIQKYIDKDWQPLIPTPNHPEYPAAHACLSASAAVALTAVFGSSVSFTDATYEYLGLAARHFNSFEEAAIEAGISRLYGGIHYRFSVEESEKIGKKAADEVLKGVKFHREELAVR
jgi:hypothetical protein